MHSDREAIAAFMYCLNRSFPHLSTIGLMDSALGSHPGDRGSIPDWGN